jgi:hypothetical protein
MNKQELRPGNQLIGLEHPTYFIADLEHLRPAPSNSLNPSEINLIVGRTLSTDVNFHDCAQEVHFEGR